MSVGRNHLSLNMAAHRTPGAVNSLRDPLSRATGPGAATAAADASAVERRPGIPVCVEPFCELDAAGNYKGLCEAHWERWLDFWAEDGRESDEGLVW